MNSQNKKNQTRTNDFKYIEIDTFKGIAIISVIIYHFTIRYDYLFNHSYTFPEFLSLGRFGVHLFFISSGFLVLTSLERIHHDFDFLFNRFSRLYPAYWFSVILTFASVSFFSLPGKEVTFIEAFLNLSMLQDWIPGVSHVDGSYWALSRFLSFYLIIFVIYKLHLVKGGSDLKNKKKVLITLPSLQFDLGGVAAYYNAIIPYLEKSDTYTIEKFEIGTTHSKNTVFHIITDQLRFIFKIIINPPHIIHINPSLNFKSFIRDGFFILIAKKMNIRVIVFFRGWEKEFENKIKGAFKLFLNHTYKKSDSFVVLASEFKNTLQRWKISKPIYLATTTVNETLLENFSISKKMHGFKKKDTIRILFLSRLERKKGVFETIDAIRILLDKNMNISLSIAGDGSVATKIHRYVEQLGLSKNIIMLGYVRENEKIKALTNHDIYCFPTYHDEGMPNSVLESMAFGMPVITTPTGGTKDFFINGKMGYLCPKPDPTIIADNLSKIIVNKKKLYEISHFNHCYARNHFYASKVAENLLNIYEKTE